MVFPKNDFCRATPESQGVKSSAITAALEAIRASGKDIHSMLVLKNGYLISETYFAPYNENTKHSMFSCSKTFTSMLIGIAQGKGLLKLSDKVASFFPDKLPEEPSENLLNMTIRDLLHMATGNDQDTYGYMT
ncbi:MAG: serine hydrolase, partial [Clostridia bacterium]|nr:serine hydrolase [Clostridia bacterium]